MSDAPFVNALREVLGLGPLPGTSAIGDSGRWDAWPPPRAGGRVPPKFNVDSDARAERAFDPRRDG